MDEGGDGHSFLKNNPVDVKAQRIPARIGQYGADILIHRSEMLSNGREGEGREGEGRGGKLRARS